jgi:hypothetical protein
MLLESRTLDALTIEDERSFRHVALYDGLKQALLRDGYRFRVAPPAHAFWDRVAFLNLTFWDAAEQGDVLADDHLAADVVTHAAWHHLTHRALAEGGGTTGGPATADALFLGESIASAFDLYLVGRLLGHAPGSAFLETQVPAMADVAQAAGLPEDAFEALLATVAADPDRAFEDLRELLFDVTTALHPLRGADAAAAALAGFEGHRFQPLLHHFEVSNWLLYARAYAAEGSDPRARAIDAALRAAPVALDYLEERWVRRAFSPGVSGR